MPIKNKTNICWICGSTANTGEHQIKRTDVTQMFGKRSFQGIVKTDFDNNGRKRVIQGANSDSLKYRNNLCAKCNNERTQLYDHAYERFANYIRDDFSKLKKTLCLSTNLVFGKNRAKKQQQDLFRYFIKAFGCQLNDNRIKVPQELKDMLMGQNFGNRNRFRVSICVNDIFQPYLHNFPLEGDQDLQGNPLNFFWAQHNGWFTVVYAYNRQISKEFGEEWFGKSRRVAIGKWAASNHREDR